MNIRTIAVYNLVDLKGSQLQLRLGYVQGELLSHENAGWRWSFEGTKIPMPVRSRTWFCGFPEKTMLNWLAEHGWFVRTKVDMASGRTVVYDLPDPEEEYPDWQFEADKAEFNQLLADLYMNGKSLKAIHLYRYAHEVCTETAVRNLNEICREV